MKYFIGIIIAISALFGKSSSETIVSASGNRITSLADWGDDASLPIVSGGGLCGGDGKSGLLRMEGCVGEGVCRIKIEEDETDSDMKAAAFEFFPSRDMASLGLLIISQYGNEQLVFDSGPIPDSSVTEGNGYVLHASVTFEELVVFSYVTTSFIIYDADESTHEDVCVDAEFYIF